MSQAKYDQRHEQGACPSSCPVCSPGRRLAFVSVCACEIQFLQMSKDAMHYNGTEGIAGSVFLRPARSLQVSNRSGLSSLFKTKTDYTIQDGRRGATSSCLVLSCLLLRMCLACSLGMLRV